MASAAWQHADNGAESGIGAAFIDGSTGEWTATPEKVSRAAAVEGDPGFPGLFGPYPGDQSA
jgi:hypothetical protein